MTYEEDQKMVAPYNALLWLGQQNCDMLLTRLNELNSKDVDGAPKAELNNALVGIATHLLHVASQEKRFRFGVTRLQDGSTVHLQAHTRYVGEHLGEVIVLRNYRAQTTYMPDFLSESNSTEALLLTHLPADFTQLVLRLKAALYHTYAHTTTPTIHTVFPTPNGYRGLVRDVHSGYVEKDMAEHTFTLSDDVTSVHAWVKASLRPYQPALTYHLTVGTQELTVTYHLTVGTQELTVTYHLTVGTQELTKEHPEYCLDPRIVEALSTCLDACEAHWDKTQKALQDMYVEWGTWLKPYEPILVARKLSAEAA